MQVLTLTLQRVWWQTHRLAARSMRHTRLLTQHHTTQCCTASLLTQHHMTQCRTAGLSTRQNAVRVLTRHQAMSRMRQPGSSLMYSLPLAPLLLMLAATQQLGKPPRLWAMSSTQAIARGMRMM